MIEKNIDIKKIRERLRSNNCKFDKEHDKADATKIVDENTTCCQMSTTSVVGSSADAVESGFSSGIECCDNENSENSDNSGNFILPTFTGNFDEYKTHIQSRIKRMNDFNKTNISKKTKNKK